MATLENLSLMEEEGGGFVVDVEKEPEQPIDLNICLVGRFLTDRSIRVHIMKVRMAEIWRLGRGVSIKDIGGVFLFQFFHKIDKERVENGGPWSFENHLLILGTIPAGEIPSQIPLFHVPFWVQVHDVPAGFMSTTVGQHLGNFIGQFLSYDLNNNSNFWKTYMRIRVLIDVRLPLKKEQRLKKPGAEWKFVKFRYEKLGIFCFVWLSWPC